MEIFTIGFTQSSAENFFGRLREHRIERLLDVRLNNKSQLAGFAKRDDLAFFLRELLNAEYEHASLLAPGQEMLDAYKKKKEMRWQQYEDSFFQLMKDRRVEEELRPEDFERRTVLLCSEATPENCHRRLIVEYLAGHWPDVTAVHL
jgi:uncharacterized protein (DUF488 family)